MPVVSPIESSGGGLILGSLLALPVPLLIAVAPAWSFVVVANLFLRASQGFAWSITVVMKIDLVRDIGFVAGALISGAVADALGPGEAIGVVAALAAASGLWVALTSWTSYAAQETT